MSVTSPEKNSPNYARKRVVMTRLSQDSQSADRILSDNRQPNETLLQGKFQYSQFRSGLIVQAGTFRELADADVLSNAGPCVCITLLLSGRIRFGYDGMDNVLDASDGAKALAVNLARQCAFRRHIVASAQEQEIRKINLLVNPEWFDKNSIPLPESVRQFLQTHLASWRWQPDQDMLKLCEEILTLDQAEDPWMHQLMLESRGQLILMQLCRQLVNCSPVQFQHVADAMHHIPDQLSVVVAYLEAHLHHDVRLQEVASATAMSVSVLQRRFRTGLGCTVFDYVRNRRLEKARDMMQLENVSVSEAAYLCGYNHPSNFITAFKRKFGITPGEC
ncbi:AraC family transcriptional regulator [Photobacterium sp. R1]